MKFKYYILNTIFIFIVIISIKDYFFKTDIYTIDIFENITIENVSIINSNLNALSFKNKPIIEKDTITNKYFLKYKYPLAERDPSLYLLEIFFNDKNEFYKIMSVYKILIDKEIEDKYPKKLQYTFKNKNILRDCKKAFRFMEIRDLRIRCAGVGPTHFIYNKYIPPNNKYGKEASFLIHDTTRWRLTYDFYTELANYYNSLLVFNDPDGIKKKNLIIQLSKGKNINLELFLKRFTYIYLIYLSIFLLIIITEQKNDKLKLF